MGKQADPRQDSSLAVLMFTDIVDSVGFKTRVGDAAYGHIVARHDVLIHAIVETIPGAKVLKDKGDGIIARFATGSGAVEAALRFQYALQREPAAPQRCVVRIGIHMGEVIELGPDPSGGNKIVGLAIDVASRVETLALPGQILLTRAPFDDARQFIRTHPPVDDVEDLPELQWKAHGPYRFQGLDDALEIFEVGSVGIAPLRPPPDSGKALRVVAPGEEDLYDWRPATGLEIPGNRHWIIDRKLGEGGYGEVWLGIQQQTKYKRAFKFCFDGERLRSLKKELAFNRLLLKNLGERDDIARLLDVKLDTPPYYLASEYAAEGDVVTWAKACGGAQQVPLATRIELIARAGRAVAAAHAAGVLHKDLKPSNVLIALQDGRPRPVIADFGVSALTDQGLQAAGQLTSMPTIGHGVLSGRPSNGTGSLMYTPPELLRGQEFTPQGDVYALGIMLYQLVVGDLGRPLGHGWEREVRDPLLRDDILRCVTADLDQRFGSPNELADRLEGLSGRRKTRRVRRVLAGAVVVLVLLETGGLLSSMHRQYLVERQLAGIQRVWHEMMMAADPQHSGNAQPTVDSLLQSVVNMLDGGRLAREPLAESEARLRLGRTFIGRGQLHDAEPQITMARDLRRASGGKGAPALVAETNHHLAYLYRTQGRLREADTLFRAVLEARRNLLGDAAPDTALTRYEYSVTLRNLNDLDESWVQLVRAMTDIEQWRAAQQPADDHAVQRARETDIEIARMYNSKARLLRERGEFAAGRAALEESLQRRVALLGNAHRDVTRTMATLAWLEHDDGHLDEAEHILREILSTQETILEPAHEEIASTLYFLGQTLMDQGRYDEAIAYAQRALRIRSENYAADQRGIADAQSLLGSLWLNRHAPDGPHAATALELLRTAYTTATQTYGTEHWRYHHIAGAYGEALCVVGQGARAAPLLDGAYAFLQRRPQPPARVAIARARVAWSRDTCAS